MARERVNTPFYADLLFSLALARAGDAAAAAALSDSACSSWPEITAVHGWLRDALLLRQQHAAEGRPARGGWPMDLRDRRNQLTREERYAVDKARQHLRALDPANSVDAFAVYAAARTEPGDWLSSSVNREQFIRRVDELVGGGSNAAKMRSLGLALVHAPRFGESIAQQMLDRMFHEIDPMSSDARQADVIARAWQAVDSARLEEPIERLTNVTVAAMSRGGWSAEVIGRVVMAAGKSLARRRLTAELIRLINRAGDLVAAGDPAMLPARLAIDGARWLAEPQIAADPAIDEARGRLFAAQPPLDLALAYIGAIGCAPAAIALRRLDEILQQMPVPAGAGMTDAWFALGPLRVIDAILQAAPGSDDDAGNLLDRWCQADELRIRARIRQDLQARGIS